MSAQAKQHLKREALVGFYLAGVEQIAPLHYAIFKGLWAGLMAAALVVPMVISALRSSVQPGVTRTAE
jgi:hypothetical protein